MSASSPRLPGSLSLRARRRPPVDPLGRAASTVVEQLESRRLMSVAASGSTSGFEGTPYQLQLQRTGTEPSVLVNWGDNSEPQLVEFTSGNTQNVSHTYVNDGAYQISQAGVGAAPLKVIGAVHVVPFDQNANNPLTASTPVSMAAGVGGTVVTAAAMPGERGVVVTRHTAAGGFDDSFSSDGVVTADLDAELPDGWTLQVNGVAVNGSGQTFVAVTQTDNGGIVTPAVVRLAADGSRLGGFSGSFPDNPFIMLFGITTTGDGAVICGAEGSGQLFVAKLSVQGDNLAPDPSFGGDGFAVDSFDSDSAVPPETPTEHPSSDGADSADYAWAVTVTNNQVVVAGPADGKLAVARYALNGEQAGQQVGVTITDASVEVIGGIVPASAGGAVLVAASVRDAASGTPDIVLARFNASGLDGAFAATTDVTEDGTPDAGFSRVSFPTGTSTEDHNTDVPFGLSIIGNDAVVTGYSAEPQSDNYALAVATFNAGTGAVNGQFRLVDDPTNGVNVSDAYQVHGRVATAGAAEGTIAVSGFAEGQSGDHAGRGLVLTTLGRGPGSGGSGFQPLSVAVQNVAPTAAVSGPTAQVVLSTEDAPIMFNYLFNDAGAADSLTTTVDFGDGNGFQPVALLRGPATTTSTSPRTFTHHFPAGGTYTVKLKVVDDAGATTMASATAINVVSLAKPAPGVVEVEAPGTNDVINVSSGTGSNVSLIVNGVGLGSFNASNRIFIDAGEGNDFVSLLGLTRPAIVLGGKGNDVILGGSGGGVITGGPGNDALTGGNGRDILIGGVNQDLLVGGNGEDVLIAGRTSYDADATALNALLTVWSNTSRSFSQRVSSLSNGSGVTGGYALRTDGGNQTVFDDGATDSLAIDILTGGGSADWYLYNYQQAGVTDIVLGLGGGDTRSDIDPN